jgi:hypothetical protein
MPNLPSSDTGFGPRTPRTGEDLRKAATQIPAQKGLRKGLDVAQVATLVAAAARDLDLQQQIIDNLRQDITDALTQRDQALRDANDADANAETADYRAEQRIPTRSVMMMVRARDQAEQSIADARRMAAEIVEAGRAAGEAARAAGEAARDGYLSGPGPHTRAGADLASSRALVKAAVDSIRHILRSLDGGTVAVESILHAVEVDMGRHGGGEPSGELVGAGAGAPAALPFTAAGGTVYGTRPATTIGPHDGYGGPLNVGPFG